jgi:hypothetical protein
MFKFEQALVLKALHMQPLLARRKEFQRRGERRQAALIRNPGFPLALSWCERDRCLTGEDMLFWSENYNVLLQENALRPPSPPRRRRRPRRRTRRPVEPSATPAQEE